MDKANIVYAVATAACMTLSILAPAIAQAVTAKQAFESVARQPEKAGDMRTMLILALGFMEALTIYGLLISFMLIGKIS